MKLVHSDIGTAVELKAGRPTSLTVENQRLFRELLEELLAQSEGASGRFALYSDCHEELPLHKSIELISQFVPFSLNRKSLLSAVMAKLEKEALSAEHWEKTQALLAEISSFVDALAMALPCDVVCEKNHLQGLLRSVGVSIAEDGVGTLERLFDYMELVRELLGERVFVLVNFREYFTKEETALFFQSAASHQFTLLLLESRCHARVFEEERLVIDEDLCEI